MSLDVSAKEDITGDMKSIHHPKLLAEIEAFLSETGMGPKYFGKASVGNSEVVNRLRKGGRVWPETEAGLVDFMARRSSQKDGAAA